MLTDIFLDKNMGSVPPSNLCVVLSEVCIPLAGRCILKLQMGEGRFHSADELMIEFELCIGLTFKPLRHHLQNVIASGPMDNVASIWKSVLSVLEELLSEDRGDSSPEKQTVVPEGLRATMHNLANEHLRNALMVLMSAGVIMSDKSSGDITSITIESVGRMGISEASLQEWRDAAESNAQ